MNVKLGQIFKNVKFCKCIGCMEMSVARDFLTEIDILDTLFRNFMLKHSIEHKEHILAP
jgi:hypothetical protein